MIRREQLPELRKYRRVEQTLQLRNDPEYARLVVPNGNMMVPGHRWFKYKESFSSDLLQHVFSKHLDSQTKKGTRAPVRLLDPFCGVGTTLLSGQLLTPRIESIGIDCNPFSAFVASTKLAWPGMNASEIRKNASALADIEPVARVTLPSLSSITSERCISRHMARRIVALRDAIDSLPPSNEQRALRVGLASAIEPLSKVRKDGRALRIISKPRVSFWDVVTQRWDWIASDVEVMQAKHPEPGRATVVVGDGRNPVRAGVQRESIDLIVTSPPYPNNIDYNEVYKLELWFLGFAKAAEDFLDLRRQTFRSHPTCQTIGQSAPDFDSAFMKMVSHGPFADMMGQVIRRVEKLEKERRYGRTKVLIGYAHDTWLSLRSHYDCLRRGGRAVYVVGNSLHGGPDKPYLVPTDLILARLAESVGFYVEEIIVARGLPRRLVGNHFLRDSVIVLRKARV